MARGKRTLTLDQRMEQVQQSITEHQEAIASLKEQYKQLQAEKESQDVQKLYDAIKSSGKTVDDVLAILNVE